MLTAHGSRTSLWLAAAAGTIVTALLLHGRASPLRHGPDIGDDGVRVEARLASTKILPGAMDHDLAVTIGVPGTTSSVRPPLSVAIVIDNSGSMSGEPLAQARAAAGRLVHALDPDDAFAIVSYASHERTIVPMTRATPADQRRALAELDRLIAADGTCVSCGLARGTDELSRSPVHGLRRMVLISDGQANEGVFDRDALADLAAATAAAGISITTVGVGLDFDEVTMVRLANVGHGNYYFAEDAAQLTAMFAHELGGLADTVAMQARLVLTDGPGARIVEAYGYPLSRTGDHVIVPIADLRAGETRKVVLRMEVAPSRTGPLKLTEVELGWQRPSDGAIRHAATIATAEVVDDVSEVAASIDVDAVQAVESARSARAIEESNQVYATHGADAARQVLELRAAQIGRNHDLDATTAARLRRTNADAIEILRSAPAARARKVNAVRAYELAR